jgi:ribonuclease HI
MQKLASMACDIYSPEGKWVSSGVVCLEPSTNNVVEYSATIELFHDAISYGVRYLKFQIESQLVVWKLNRSYLVQDMTLIQ